MCTDTLTLIPIGRSHEVFHDEFILFTWAAPQGNRIGDTLMRRILTILKCLTLKWLYK